MQDSIRSGDLEASVSRKRDLVLLVQLPIPPMGLDSPRGNIPLAAGYLKAYAQSRLPCGAEIDILPQAVTDTYGDAALVAEILGRRPSIIGFSCYLWNVERTLWIARQLKQQQPCVTVVLGGPEITPDNAWVMRYAPADYAVVGEGEASFARLLWALIAKEFNAPAIPGVVVLRDSLGFPIVSHCPKPELIESLDEVPSPYLAGVLKPDGEGTVYLETVRGCHFRCRYCYYPKSFPRLRKFSPSKVLLVLHYAASIGAKEVVLIDPSLNGRNDFDQLLGLLAQGNSGKQFAYSAELRAELLRPGQAEKLAAAGVAEVEIGLQTVDPLAQRLSNRRTDLHKFAEGAKALADAGIRRRVDLIIGLPGDTVDSVRRSIEFLANNKLYDEVQVFNLLVLPGTAFRRHAKLLGLDYQERPPYAVLRTPTLHLGQIEMLLEEAEAAFGTLFDPLPEPTELLQAAEQAFSTPAAQRAAHAAETGHGRFSGDSPVRIIRVSLDDAFKEQIPSLLPPPQSWANSLVLWMRSSDFDAARNTAAAVIGHVLEQAPHTALQVLLEPQGDYRCVSSLALATLLGNCFQTTNYLDHYYSVQPRRIGSAKRLIVIAPEAARNDRRWRHRVTNFAEIVFRGDGRAG